MTRTGDQQGRLIGKGRIGLVVALAALTLGATTASAGNTEITIKEQGGDFSGKVKSDNGYCEGDNRTVKLFKKKPGKDSKIATDTTDIDSAWATGNTGENQGRFYAVVKAVASCDKAKSKTIEL